MALSKKGKKNKAARVAAKRQEKRRKQEETAEERKADRVARGLPAVAPKPPKKKTTWSGQDAPLPPPQLIDAIHEWLRDYHYIKAAHGVRTDNQKRPGHNMMLWKGTAQGLPQLNNIFMQWKEQNPDLAKSEHERAEEAKAAAGGDTSSDSDDDSSSDSGSDSSEESEAVGVATLNVPSVSAGMKRKADDMSDGSSSSSDSGSTSDSDSDSDSDSSSDSQEDSTEPHKDAAAATGASDSSATVDGVSLGPAAKQSKAIDNDVSTESSDDSSSSDSESGSDSESDSESSSDSSSSEDEGEAAGEVTSSSSSSSSSASDSDSPAPRKAKPTPNATIASESTLTANGAPAAKRARPDSKGAPAPNKPFSRIADDVEVDPRFSSNAYVPYDYADRAHADLSVVRGKGFTKEKNKKKRGQGFRGGAIDVSSRAIKFED